MTTNDSIFWIRVNGYLKLTTRNLIRGNKFYNEKIYLDNFFCFGDYEEYMYKKYNHHVNNYLPVGSFRNSIAECLYEKNENFFRSYK